MLTRDFDYHLPKHLIAQLPNAQREASRLLQLGGEGVQARDRQFIDIVDLLEPGDLMVFNNTKVIPARLYGVKATGGKVEVLVERILSDHAVLAHIRASKAPKVGAHLHLEAHIQMRMRAREGDLFHLEVLNPESIWLLLERYGHIPLPPYIERSAQAIDRDRYQTVYAQQLGAVAAPTAGLHFSENLLAALAQKGVLSAFVTLHVGAGTFQPVRAEQVRDHVMHAEYVHVTQAVCTQIQQTQARGARVVAVGTTAVRSLETAARAGRIEPYQGDTNLFITPGYDFHCVDALITNFHLPQSTLLMLVCAFAGFADVMAAYQHAIAQEYRFFSYGDAMLLHKKGAADGV